MLLMITPPTRSRYSQYSVQFPPGRHERPDDGPVTGPKHVVYKSNKYYTTIFSCVRLLLPLHQPVQLSALDFVAHYGTEWFKIKTFNCQQRSVQCLRSVSAYHTSPEARFHFCSLYNYFTVSCLGFPAVATHISVLGSVQAGYEAHAASHHYVQG